MSGITGNEALPAVPGRAQRSYVAVAWGRPVLLLVVLASLACGFLATGIVAAHGAAEAAGPELTRLLRAMAALKVLFVAGAVGAAWWRMRAPVTVPLLAAYAAACGAMCAGPGLIWDMAHLKLGAMLLHGGLLATVLLLWRDPASSRLLAQAIASRRARLG